MALGVEKAKWIEERRIRQYVPTVERNAKFRSSPTEADLCTAENVILNEDPHEDIKLIKRSLRSVRTHFFPFTTNDNK